jgi:predicted amidophosphoribosyltransferase
MAAVEFLKPVHALLRSLRAGQLLRNRRALDGHEKAREKRNLTRSQAVGEQQKGRNWLITD